MSDSNTRTEIYDRLRELSELIPEMRSAQLIAAIGELCADLHGRGLWAGVEIAPGGVEIIRGPGQG